MVFEFHFHIEPVAKARPRFAKGRVYTAPKTAYFEESLRNQCYQLFTQMPLSERQAYRALYEAELSVQIEFTLTRPLKTKYVNYPAGKPDVSNLLKSAEDAMNGLLWKDDAQLCDVRCRKIWGDHGAIKITVAALPALC